MRRKNYITIGLDPSYSDPNYYVGQVINPPTDSSNSTDSTNTTNNKGDFWKTLVNIAGGLFSNKQPQQMDIPAQNPPKNKPNYGLIIGIIVAAIVVGVAIYFMTRK
jgi:hypothetical protein